MDRTLRKCRLSASKPLAVALEMKTCSSKHLHDPKLEADDSYSREPTSNGNFSV